MNRQTNDACRPLAFRERARSLSQPVIVGLGMLRVVAANEPENQHVRKFIDALLALIGVAFLAYTGWRTYADWATLDPRQVALEFLLPVWLTVGLLPCIYVLSLLITYDSALRGINWAAKDGRPRWRARLALVTGLHFGIVMSTPLAGIARVSSSRHRA